MSRCSQLESCFSVVFFPLAIRLACQDQRLPLKPGSLSGSLPTRACFLLPSIVRFSAALLQSLPSHGGRDGQESRFIDTPRHRSKEKKAVFVKVEPVKGESKYNIYCRYYAGKRAYTYKRVLQKCAFVSISVSSYIIAV